MKARLVFVFVLLLQAQTASAQPRPSLPEADRIRIAEAFRIAERLGNRVWKDWDRAPFAVLFVTPETEFLIRHPRPSDDFAPLGHDALLKSDVYFRQRQFAPDLLATFPAVGGVSTIVIGQAENTARNTSTSWVLTMLHEHFHQLQTTRPDYYAEVNALNLSRGDQSGMWMLNYDFPYSAPDVKRHFKVMSTLLAQALKARGKKELSARVAAYLEARRKFEGMLAPDDYKYFTFQMWQEGIARHTEYRIAELAARSYKPSGAFRGLKDYKPFRVVAGEQLKKLVGELTTLRLDEYKRVAFYPLGAGEALLLDKVNPRWKDRYHSDRFYVERYFDKARGRLRSPGGSSSGP